MDTGWNTTGTTYVVAHPNMTLLIVPIAIGTVLWILIASSRFIQGDSVNDRVAQLYGYTVCLVAVVTLLFAVPSLVDQALSLSSDGSQVYGVSIRTFDDYKATRDAGARQAGESVKLKSDAELRAEYEAIRADRLSAVHAQATRSLISGSIMVVLALGLFIFHWRWLRQRTRSVDGSQA